MAGLLGSLPCGFVTALFCATCAAAALDISRAQGMPTSALEHGRPAFDQQEQSPNLLPGSYGRHNFLFAKRWWSTTTQLIHDTNRVESLGTLNNIKANINMCARQPNYE
ncbi:predicted protein [Pyrenophora tritici-repentis Pt-1C-BFP]|uniref:Uncharacterized protein n=1 Tax=Pyrenophora tritici-repentis (strain Pt-1C-BFP) TaxID=426418 RepID=B2W4U5_PYRTR|nr:uncharacterized protein PTRG_04645 [Pyrenophora tritici-repentis Pt-1C-BFP]EDU47552.1 predicted protein [Pyrenophora tritici-repentis Pt-1C-BFP]